MKKNIIELPVSELKTALTGLNKVVGKRFTLPVLGSIRVSRDHEGQVSLQGTDLDSFATYRTIDVQHGDPVEFLVPMEELAKTAKTAKDKVNLYPDGKDSVVIQTLVGNTPVEQQIASLDPKEFPPEPKFTQPPVALTRGSP